ncbi:MAG: hypothetical protein KAS32_13415 [Candidatus Peribacteraceae bacterium]|nr:hypothetical protein [Candidatus Peribacteraceae bacterium]
MSAIVTKESLQNMMDSSDEQFVQRVIGRALVGIFDRQTEDEKHSDATLKHNGIGFTGADAHSGSLTAKYWLRHNSLLDWQIDMWTKKNVKGFSRLTKYHKQLNSIAEEKQAAA